ncbi:GIY-YIG nuclease family protein [Bacteroidota bacterium]
MLLPYCTYVLYSIKDLKFYIGYSTNIQERIKDHNAGKTKNTAPRRPFQLIFCEFYFSKRNAQRREKYLKTTAGKKALKIMLRDTLTKLNQD